MSVDRRDRRVVVIGLGRFGSSLAVELASSGWDVLGIDADARLVQKVADELAHAAVADSTDVEALRQLGVHEFRRAVVGIGNDLEASILTTSFLVDMQVPEIWAKAISRDHGRILDRVGAHHVVLPEHEMGERVAHLVASKLLDYVEFEQDFALAKIVAPLVVTGKSLRDSDLRNRYGLTVAFVKSPGHDMREATSATVINDGDVLLVAGRIADVERFSNV